MQTNTKLYFELTTVSQGTIWKSTILEAILPTTTGTIGILPGHTNLITTVEAGLLQIRKDKLWIPFLVFGGSAMVKKNSIYMTVSEVEKIEKNYKDLEKVKILYEKTKKKAIKILENKNSNKIERLKAINLMKLEVSRIAAYNILQSQNL
ncbi:MAG: hypothetical protein GY791_19085 [Alphaproteobacteria bacterium]|nr:hypothetical protein [Alphaproteobacteria bacterium]